MSSATPSINTVPLHHGHSHFYDWIEFGSHLPVGPSLEEQHKTTLKKLRHQLINDNDYEKKLCYRTCFKLTESKYVQFCLDRKCGGTTLEAAAAVLGYNRTLSQTAGHGHGHHAGHHEGANKHEHAHKSH